MHHGYLGQRKIVADHRNSVHVSYTHLRRPQIGKVIVRSIFDRTLLVLGRAAMVAAPAGMLIWVMANLTLDGQKMCIRDR